MPKGAGKRANENSRRALSGLSNRIVSQCWGAETARSIPCSSRFSVQTGHTKNEGNVYLSKLLLEATEYAPKCDRTKEATDLLSRPLPVSTTATLFDVIGATYLQFLKGTGKTKATAETDDRAQEIHQIVTEKLISTMSVMLAGELGPVIGQMVPGSTKDEHVAIMKDVITHRFTKPTFGAIEAGMEEPTVDLIALSVSAVCVSYNPIGQLICRRDSIGGNDKNACCFAEIEIPLVSVPMGSKRAPGDLRRLSGDPYGPGEHNDKDGKGEVQSHFLRMISDLAALNGAQTIEMGENIFVRIGFQRPIASGTGSIPFTALCVLIHGGHQSHTMVNCKAIDAALKRMGSAGVKMKTPKARATPKEFTRNATFYALFAEHSGISRLFLPSATNPEDVKKSVVVAANFLDLVRRGATKRKKQHSDSHVQQLWTRMAQIGFCAEYDLNALLRIAEPHLDEVADLLIHQIGPEHFPLCGPDWDSTLNGLSKSLDMNKTVMGILMKAGGKHDPKAVIARAVYNHTRNVVAKHIASSPCTRRLLETMWDIEQMVPAANSCVWDRSAYSVHELVEICGAELHRQGSIPAHHMDVYIAPDEMGACKSGTNYIAAVSTGTQHIILVQEAKPVMDMIIPILEKIGYESTTMRITLRPILETTHTDCMPYCLAVPPVRGLPDHMPPAIWTAHHISHYTDTTLRQHIVRPESKTVQGMSLSDQSLSMSEGYEARCLAGDPLYDIPPGECRSSYESYTERARGRRNTNEEQTPCLGRGGWNDAVYSWTHVFDDDKSAIHIEVLVAPVVIPIGGKDTAHLATVYVVYKNCSAEYFWSFSQPPVRATDVIFEALYPGGKFESDIKQRRALLAKYFINKFIETSVKPIGLLNSPIFGNEPSKPTTAATAAIFDDTFFDDSADFGSLIREKLHKAIAEHATTGSKTGCGESIVTVLREHTTLYSVVYYHLHATGTWQEHRGLELGFLLMRHFMEKCMGLRAYGAYDALSSNSECGIIAGLETECLQRQTISHIKTQYERLLEKAKIADRIQTQTMMPLVFTEDLTMTGADKNHIPEERILQDMEAKKATRKAVGEYQKLIGAARLLETTLDDLTGELSQPFPPPPPPPPIEPTLGSTENNRDGENISSKRRKLTN